MDNLMTVAAVMLAAAGLIVLALIWIVRERRTINPLSPQQIGDLIRRLDHATRQAECRLIELQRLTGQSPGDPPAAPAHQPLHVESSQAVEPADVQEPQSPLAPPRPEPQQGEILRLHRQGLDLVEIARRLELTVGEVELTVNLSKSLGRYVAVKPQPASPAQDADLETPD